jgi:hypothetical protein
MVSRRVGAGMGLLLASASMFGQGADAAGPAVSTRKDGSIEIAGRAVQCGTVRAKLDPRLPGLGAAAPAMHLLILNPRGLQRQPDNVRLFVYHHECGHHHVGASELQADCWAVNRGVRDGWLDAAGLKQVCTSFGGMPETPTHPSAARRCRNLDMCFSSVTAAVRRELAEKVKADAKLEKAAVKPPQSPSPDLVSGPTFIHAGAVP